MVQTWSRPLLAVLAAAALAAGLVALAVSGSGGTPASAAQDRYVIEITSTGFNPAVCVLNRDDS